MIKIYEKIEVPNMPKLYTQSLRELETLPYIILSGSDDNYHLILCDMIFKGGQLTNNYDNINNYMKIVKKLVFRILYPIKKDTININDEYHMAGWLKFVIDNGRLLYETNKTEEALKYLMFSRYILSHGFNFDNKKPFAEYRTMMTKKEGHVEDPYNNAKETHYKIYIDGNLITFNKYYKPKSIYNKKCDYNNNISDTRVKEIIGDILENNKLRNMIYDNIKNI